MSDSSKLISNAVTEIVDGYTGHVMPSLYSVQPSPFDVPENTPLQVSKAIRTIEAAAAQLSITVASPGHVVLNFQEPACMLVAADAKIADHLLDKPAGVHVDELALKTGVDSDKLSRVLRLLATKHCFTEDPQTTSSVTPDGSAFVRAHGCNLFDYLASPEQQERSEVLLIRDARFQVAMVAWGQVNGRAMLPKVYPWASLPADTIICDVGGGNGHATVPLLKAFPQLKIMVQDLPGVVEQGKEFLNTEITDVALRERVQYVPLDFFNGTPVQDCDFYYVSKSKLAKHDWPNPACQQILDSICRAMSPSSRLLIHELVLQHVVRGSVYDGIFDRAPEPLLPNYGLGNVRPYTQDITMLFMLNGKERTLQEFIDMAARCGLKFLRLWGEGVATPLLEFEKAPPEV
ncbi:S-adenosyl-L-methionine-dependent methyltransferase [Mycena rosella]|uniref:S-adenosyl-L-methionine-dependent methyltransferase n=1 Tax=Mycena rosella TaxID=1033263 RepID=A0AAD7G5Y0_MYCRO|nr:S-adenosyl-L-methionine-dependent methyltransferase [Mycena rosella]